MEVVSTGDAANLAAFDPFAWPLCDMLSREGTVWLAPHIPQPVLVAILTNYLDLAEDEVLLAVVAGTAGQVPSRSCALTTRRIYWAGDPRRDVGTWDDPDHPAARVVAPPPVRSEYIAYKDLPQTIARSGVLSRVIDLGDGLTLSLGGHVPLQKALIAFLTRVRALVRGEEPLPELPPAVAEVARRAWPAVLAADVEARALQAELRVYHDQTAIPAQGVVTFLMAAACVLVYVAMVVRGVSPLQPDNAALIGWGADFGPLVAFDGQIWRLGTSIFLHIGLIHLAMNMWCLLSTGPVVERFFGHLGYAALYVLSGLGGGIASLLVHPTIICAGASGAIFGVFGGLLGYLAVRHGEVPAAILGPMRSGTLGFVGYNVIYGLTNPEIDMAAHLGGLATGFVVGLLLAGDWVHRRDRVGLLRRAGLIAVLSVGLCLLTGWAIGLARGRLLADPEFGPKIRAKLDTAPTFNAFVEALNPLLHDFDRIAAGIERVEDQIDRGDVPTGQIERTLDDLIADSDAIGRQLGTLTVVNEEFRAMSNRLVAAKTRQRQILDLLRRFLKERDPTLIDGADGLEATTKDYIKDFEELHAMLVAYMKSHGLVEKKP